MCIKYDNARRKQHWRFKLSEPDGLRRRSVCLGQNGAFLNEGFLTVFGLVVTLTINFLTSKSNQFIFVPTAP